MKNVLNNKKLFHKNEEIVGDKPKDIVIFGSIGNNTNEKGTQNISLKLPKMNPLCGLSAPSKTFNKFDMIPRNYVMIPIDNNNTSPFKVDDVSKSANATTLPNENKNK